MAEEQQTASYGELRGQVQGLERDFAQLTVRFDRGFASLETLFRDYAKATDTRFEDAAKAQLRSAENKSSNYSSNLLAIFGVVIALGSLAVTLYTLTKEPIEQRFKSLEKTADKNSEEFMPKTQVVSELAHMAKRIDEEIARRIAFQATQDQNSRAITGLQTQVATNTADFQRTRDDLKQLSSVTVAKDSYNQLLAQTSTFVTKEQFGDLRTLVTTLANRIQGVYDRNYVTPKFPCVGDACVQSGPSGR